MARTRQKRSKTMSIVEPPDGDHALEASRQIYSVGATLRAERERRGWDLGDVAQNLKIRRVHLEAIEDDRFDLVPSGTYAVNFVRAYSEILGLDSVEMVRRYRDALSGGDRRLELHFPQPLPESKLPGGIILLVSAAIAALAYGAWLAMNQGMRDTLARVDPVPQQLQQSAASAPPPVRESAEASTASPAPAAPTADTGSAAAVARPPAAETSSTSAGAAATVPTAPPAPSPPPAQTAAPSPPAVAATTVSPPAAPAPVPPAAPAPPAPAPAAAAAGAPSLPAAPPPPAQLAAVPTPAPVPQPQVTETPQGTRIFGDGGAGARIVITAQADSWVQVREASGATIFMRILKAGDVYQVPNRPGLLLTTGSAGSIELKVDGKVAPSLGNKGFVRRDVPLEPERLLAGTAGEPARPPQPAPGRGG